MAIVVQYYCILVVCAMHLEFNEIFYGFIVTVMMAVYSKLPCMSQETQR